MHRRLRFLLTALGWLGVGLVLALAVNTWRQGSRQLSVPTVAGLAVDAQGAARSLSAAIRARTVSSLDDATLNADQFQSLQTHLAARYPRVHAQLQREQIGLSLLYTWVGSDVAKEALALMAHQDVVPIAPGTEGDWQTDPFAGEIRDGFVWGRGAWDDKGNLIAQMEAVEALLASGFRPSRTIYLIFGADEEVGGERGARQIAALLKTRGVRLDFVVDEGLLITEGVLAGLDAPAALVGIAEKGYLSLRLAAKATPGHSSMPPLPGRSAIGQLAEALHVLDTHPMPAAIGGVAAEMFDTLAPELGGFSRVALSNRWLFGPVLESRFAQAPGTSAAMRTTTALTMLQAGNKDNVLPGRAEAVVNFRLLPGDSIDAVTRRVASLVGEGGIEIAALPFASESSRIGSTGSDGYRAINRTVRELFPGTVVAPGLMLGATDARHFEGLSKQVLRFSPVRAKPDDLARFHGTNERIAVANLADLIRFYHRLLQQSAGV